MRLRVGVLALQGCVQLHRRHLEAAGAEYVEVRSATELAGVDGLIIPGGESTTHLKLIDLFSLEAPLRENAERIPYWGICAGAILMAHSIAGLQQRSLALVDVGIERNAYGRQIESFSTTIDGCLVPFIRAPRITALHSKRPRTLATFQDNPIWVEQGRHMVTTFHPELASETPSPMHRYFISKMRADNLSATPAKG